MLMTVSAKRLILSLSALALLAGCDDSGDTNKTSNLMEWLQPSKSQPIASFYIPQREYAQETLAGNYLAGQFAQYRQDWTKASQYMDRVLERDPGNMELQQRAMILAVQSGDINRAIGIARKLVDQKGDNSLSVILIASEQLGRQDYAGALSTLDEMPVNSIANFIKPMMQAWARAPEGPRDDSRLVDAGSHHAYHALLIADYTGKVKDPERYLANILASSEIDSHIMEKVGDVLARHGKEDLAKEIYAKLIEHKKSNGAAEHEVKLLEDKKAQPKSYASAKIETPAHGMAEGLYNIAYMLYEQGAPESALAFSRLAEYLSPVHEENKILLAGIMMESGQPEQAISILKNIRSENPIYIRSQRSIAELMEKNGKQDEAVAYLEEIYAQHKDVAALVQIGDVWRRADKHDQAIKAYDRAVNALGGKVPAEFWNLLYARGMSYERFGNLNRAEEDLLKAIEYQPNHPYLLNYLGYTWADQGKNMKQALELIEKAAALRPDDGYITDSHGWVHYKNGDFKEAVIELERAAELIPNDPTINDHLGDAYWQAGRKQEARFQWQRALNNNKKGELVEATVQKKIADGLPKPAKDVQQAKQDSSEKKNTVKQ
jgi:tetratricopeptide (TPR) repeat protein